MLKLKNIFVSDAGQFIHLGFAIVLSLLSVRHWIALILLMGEILYLWKNNRSILAISIILSLFIVIRYITMTSINKNDNERIDNNPSGIVTDINNDYLTVKINGKKWFVYYKSPQDFIPGDLIILDGYMIKNHGYLIPHNFNYDNYLLGLAVQQTFYATSIEKTDHRFHLNQTKVYLKKYISKITNDKTMQVIMLMLFGDDTYLEEEVSSSILQMGITHLFVISGMHLGLIVLMIKKLLGAFHLSIQKEDLITSFFILIYTFFCGFTISMIRSALLLFLLFISKNRKILLSKIDLLSLILSVFLIVNPYMIHLVSFQLSFMLTFVILLLGSRFSSKVEVINLGLISLITTIFGLPITLEINGGFNIWVVPMGVFFGLLVSKIILPGMFLSIIIPFFMPAFNLVSSMFIKLIQYSNELTYMIRFNLSTALFKVAFWLIIIIFFISKITLKRFVLVSISLCLVVIFNMSINYWPFSAYVRILDVGQGDSIHLHDSKCDLLIDTGNKDNYDRVINYFLKSNIQTLDYLIITHQHDDHLGESIDIQSKMDVKYVISNPAIPRNNDSNLLIPKINSVFTCGKFKLTILHYSDMEKEENNNSIVLLAEIYNQKWLFTGDIEREIEQRLLTPIFNNIDIVKVPHHGSDTSSSYDFVKKISPKYAIISVGKNNLYRHPSYTIIERWTDVNAKVLRTDELGTITWFYYENDKFRIDYESKKNQPFYYFKRSKLN